VPELEKFRSKNPANDNDEDKIKQDEEHHSPSRPKAIRADEHPMDAVLRRFSNHRWQKLVQDTPPTHKR
jgi:hypothetical protein